MNKKNTSPKPEEPYLKLVDKFPLRLAAARTKLLNDRPYYASVVLSFQGPFETNRMPMSTIGVDRWMRLYYDPKFIEDTPIDELVGVLCHEVNHVLRNHPERMEAMTHEDWQAGKQLLANLAADLEENPAIRDDGLKLPDFACFPKTFKLDEGLLAEVYYEKLLDKAPKVQVDCGSCADGRQREHEFGDPDGNGSGDGKGENGEGTAPGISVSERKLIQRKVAEDVEMCAAKNPGSVPGWLRRWADEIKNPKVPWQEVLRAAIRHAEEQVRGKNDYTYSRRSRRQSASPDVVLPGMTRPIPRTALLIDTSGSMTEAMLAQGLGEVKGVLSALGHLAALDVLCVDAAVQSRQRVFDAKKVQLLGGGGTVLETGIEELEKRRPRPQVLVVYTDGFNCWRPEPPRGMNTIIIRTDPSGAAPPWNCRVIDIDVKEAA